MPKPRHRIIIAVLAVLAVLLLVVVTVGSMPAVCGSCHAMKPYAAALQRSAHKNVSCYSCHLAAGSWDWPAFKAGELFRMYPASLFGAKPSGSATPVSRAACLSCHASVLDHGVNSNGIRIDHAACAATGSCDSCHASIAHGTTVRWSRQPVMEECVVCHISSKAPRTCNTCHAGKVRSQRLEAGPWQITHGPAWKTTHGMGELRYCQTCHPADYCVKCHGMVLPHPVDFPATHGAQAMKAGAKCTQCHDRTSFCDSCHGIQMPHPEGFLKKHSSIAKSSTDPACLKCHLESDCKACHEDHIHPGSTRGTLGTNVPRPKGSVQ